MGCCLGPEIPPREDLPTQGFKCYFKISAEGMLSSDFIAYDNDQTGGNPVSAPWLKLVHSGSLDKDEGTVMLEKKAKAEGDGPLLQAEVGQMQYQTIESQSSEDYFGDDGFGYGDIDWFDFGEPDNTRLAWGATRSVKVAAGATAELSAKVTMKYAGVARCEKDTDYQSTGDRDVRFNSWAETKNVNIKLEIAGKEVELQHNLGSDRGGNGNFAQTYKVDGIFDMEYKSNWGADEVLINVEEGGDPLTACTVGFIIAYWLHAQRVENFAKENAERILRSQQGFDW